MLLTDVDALYTAPPSQPGSRRVEYVPNVIDALGDIQVSGSGSKVGTGGMVTKWKRRVLRRSPAFPQCSPARQTQARP